MWTVSHLSGVEYPFFFPGTRYNIIEIPPQKSNCSDTLEGAKVLCSIAPMDKMKPSYYHSFGKNVSCLLCYGFCLLWSRRGCLLPSAPGLQFFASFAKCSDGTSFVPFSGMSENYIIFIEQPIKLNLMRIITSKFRGKPISEGINWEPQHSTRFHVVNKHTGEVGGSVVFPAALQL